MTKIVVEYQPAYNAEKPYVVFDLPGVGHHHAFETEAAALTYAQQLVEQQRDWQRRLALHRRITEFEI